MGVVTVYVKEGCRFCDIVLSLLTTVIASLAPEVAARLRVQVLDITNDYSRAQQCKQLSGEHTVPQVFFNAQHMGNCARTETFHKAGLLRTQLETLASGEDAVFPPPLTSKLVRLTSDVAFAAALTSEQASGLGRQGFHTVINLMHDDEQDGLQGEAAILASHGVAYVHIPPRSAPHFASGVIVASAAAWLALASPQMVAMAGGVGERSPLMTAYSLPPPAAVAAAALSSGTLLRAVSMDSANEDGNVTTGRDSVVSVASSSAEAEDAIIVAARTNSAPNTLASGDSALSLHGSALNVDGGTAAAAAMPLPPPVQSARPASCKSGIPLAVFARPMCCAREIFARHAATISGHCARAVSSRTLPASFRRYMQDASTSMSAPTTPVAASGAAASPPRPIPLYRRSRRHSNTSIRCGGTPCATVPECADVEEGELSRPAIPAATLAPASNVQPNEHLPTALPLARSLRSSSQSSDGSAASAVIAARRSSVTSDFGTTASTMSEELVDEDGLRTFDVHDDDVGGRDPLEAAFTLDWAERVLAELSTCAKPVLLHDRTGVAACTMGLLFAAKRRKSDGRQVHKWAADLGYIIEQHTDLAALVSGVLST